MFCTFLNDFKVLIKTDVRINKSTLKTPMEKKIDKSADFVELTTVKTKSTYCEFTGISVFTAKL